VALGRAREAIGRLDGPGIPWFLTPAGGARTEVINAHETVFFATEFLLLVVCSLIAPAVIYRTLWSRQTISRAAVLFFGISLVVLAGIDVFLLRVLATLARLSPSVVDDAVSDSGPAVAFYPLPTLFAGTGINIVSRLVIHHLAGAERRFDAEHHDSIPARK